jgi:DNA invertase Pin-like site-specific DNA recombinase
MQSRQTTAIYAHKSTESEDRQVLSIDSQVKELTAFAGQAGLVVHKVFRESKSAKAPGRPVFSELMGLLGKHEFDSVLCWKLDRLARNPVDGGALIWALEQGDFRSLHTPQRAFENTGNDKFWMQLEFGMAKKFVDDLSDNTKRGLRAKLEQGWKPGPPPLGYLNDKETKTIVTDPERFGLVRRMWNLMLTGNSSASRVLRIATDEWGLRSRTFTRIGGGKIAYSTIHDMLTNPFYCGLIRYNEGMYQGAHKPMVSKSEFDRVQEYLSARSRSRPKGLDFKYRGLMTCGECGASVTAEKKTKPSGRRYVYYHCTKKKRNVQCDQGSIEEKELERQILDYLETIRISKPFLEWAVKVLKELEEQEAAQVDQVRASLQRRITACEREKQELVGLRLRGLLTDEEFGQKKGELENEKLSLQESLDGLQDKATVVTEQCEAILDFARSAKNRFRHGSDGVKRGILEAIGSNHVLMDGMLRIQAKKPLQCIKKHNGGLTGKDKQVRTPILGCTKHTSRPFLDGFCAGLRKSIDVRTIDRRS